MLEKAISFLFFSTETFPWPYPQFCAPANRQSPQCSDSYRSLLCPSPHSMLRVALSKSTTLCPVARLCHNYCHKKCPYATTLYFPNHLCHTVQLFLHLLLHIERCLGHIKGVVSRKSCQNFSLQLQICPTENGLPAKRRSRLGSYGNNQAQRSSLLA